MKYSVVVPVYNAENTLRRCVDSIMNQNFTDMQLILINDGSPDNSGKICEEYAKKYDNVLYIEQENSGVSATRNKGMDIAEGEYILFVDSDDYVSDDYFEVIDNEINSFHPDMLIFSLNYVGEEKQKICEESFYTDKLEVATKFDELSGRSFMNALWLRTFKRDILNNNHIRMNPNLSIGEDVAFIYEYSLYVNVLRTCSSALYFVDESNTDSLSRKKREYLSDNMYDLNVDMEKALNKAKLQDDVKEAYKKTIRRGIYYGALVSCKELYKFDYSKKYRRKKIKAICKRFKSRRMKPDCFKTWIIALPVRLKCAFVIDFIITHR